jgi:hypothetical protein
VRRNFLGFLFLFLFLIGRTDSVWPADVTLAWDPKFDASLSGYKIHYGTASRSYSTTINTGTVTSYTVKGLTSGTYYFAVTAYYSAGTETGYSNEVSGNPASVVAYKTASNITIDGSITESVWNRANAVTFSNTALSDNQVKVSILWDDMKLYFAYDVRDAKMEALNTNLYVDDGAEFFLDVANNKSTSIDVNDFHIASNINHLTSLTGVTSRTAANPGGYTMEIAVPWSVLKATPSTNMKMGLLLCNNDRDNGVIKQFDWLNVINTGNYSRPNLWGEVVLGPNLLLPAPTNITLK